MKSVSIITVNYNQTLVTEILLKSLSEKCKYYNTEIIVVDNASSVNPVPHWLIKYPNYKFIRSDINLGFAGGNNLGISISSGEYLFLINNDTEITDNLIEDLINTMESNPKIGILSPKICYFDQPDIIQYTGYTQMNYITGRNTCIGQYEKDYGQFDHLTGKTGYAHGAAMMVSREVIQKVGKMDESYFLYYEELDWCERIKNAGYYVWVNTQVKIYHKESLSVGKNSSLKEYYMNRNRIFFMRKHAPSKKYFLFLFYFVSIIIPRNFIRYLKGKQLEFVPLLFKAFFWNLSLKNKNNS